MWSVVVMKFVGEQVLKTVSEYYEKFDAQTVASIECRKIIGASNEDGLIYSLRLSSDGCSYIFSFNNADIHTAVVQIWDEKGNLVPFSYQGIPRLATGKIIPFNQTH